MGYLAFFIAWVVGLALYLLSGSAIVGLSGFILPLAGYWLYRSERAP